MNERVNEVVLWLRSLWPFGGHMIIPERRRRTRWLTLKNVVRAAVVFVVAFILLSLWSEFRPAHSGAGLERPPALPVDSPSVAREPVPVIQEGSTNEVPPADSLGLPAPSPPPARKPVPEPPPRLGDGQRIMISGGSEGVQLHVDTTPAPVKKPAPATGTER